MLIKLFEIYCWLSQLIDREYTVPRRRGRPTSEVSTTATLDVTKAIPVGELRTKIFSIPKVKSLWNNIVEACPYPVSLDCSKIYLENIIFLYLKIRAFSLAKDIINKYKNQNVANSKKALRKTLKQESNDI